MIQGYNLLFELMEVLGKKWVAPLLIFLFVYDATSFSKIKKSLRLTSRALSKKLKLLEALGLVERIANQPKKVVYALSKKGKETSKVLLSFSSV